MNASSLVGLLIIIVIFTAILVLLSSSSNSTNLKTSDTTLLNVQQTSTNSSVPVVPIVPPVTAPSVPVVPPVTAPSVPIVPPVTAPSVPIVPPVTAPSVPVVPIVPPVTAPSVPVVPIVPPVTVVVPLVTCTGDSVWGNQTTTAGNIISKTCLDGSKVTAMCGADGKWANVGNCPIPVVPPIVPAAITSCSSDSNNGNCDPVLTSSTCRVRTQSDGNVVVYNTSTGKAIWASQTPGKGTPPYNLVMQPDGNLVLYDSKKAAIWASNTVNKGTGPYKAVMQDDCNFVVYDSKKAALWSSNDALNAEAAAKALAASAAAKTATASATLAPVTCTGDSVWGNQTTTAGNTISKTCPDGSKVTATCGTDGKWVNVGNCPAPVVAPIVPIAPTSCSSDSNSGNCDSVLTSSTCNVKTQSDGNVVVYNNSTNKVIWASNTQNKGAAPYNLVMQPDGNLVLYDSKKAAIWASNTINKGTGPYKAVMQDDCNFVVYDSKKAALWSSNDALATEAAAKILAASAAAVAKPTFETSKNITDIYKNNMTISKCTNWPNNDPNTCNANAPSGTKGWIKCAIGSDPTTTSCSAYTPNQFSCAWGQDCFAVTSFSAPPPPPVTCAGNSVWGNQTTTAGNTISKTCPDGSKVTATCGTDGKWVNVGNCSAPPPPPVSALVDPLAVTCTADANWSYQTTTVGNTISRTCPDGSKVTATCGSNGTWSNVGNCPAPVATAPSNPGYAPVTHTKDNTCIDSNGSSVYIGSCNGGDYQKWSVSGGTVKHLPSGKCLDGDGNSVYISNCNSTAYQSWTKSGNLLKHGQSGKCLDSNGSSLYFGSCDTTNSYQQWS